jgi:hypothetical protein
MIHGSSRQQNWRPRIESQTITTGVGYSWVTNSRLRKHNVGNHYCLTIPMGIKYKVYTCYNK